MNKSLNKICSLHKVIMSLQMTDSLEHLIHLNYLYDVFKKFLKLKSLKRFVWTCNGRTNLSCFIKKYIYLCFEDEQKPYRFGMTKANK